MTTASFSVSSETLTRDECQRRLDDATVARVLLSVRGLPAALPARIELVESTRLVLSSRENAVLLAARRGDVLSVQIDGISQDDRTWSVTVTGLALWASPDEFESERFKRITDCGTSLFILPLSVVSGQRAH
jgi:nitroimidazol reductase NimA-like FMN-containing flavoprotein (pyridoxamine 5'-phosphate oxidase superfamily)